MVLRIPISEETGNRLRTKAAAAGVDVETFAMRTLERVASRPTLKEVLAPLRAEFEASGTTEDQLIDELEQAKHELRAQKRAGKSS